MAENERKKRPPHVWGLRTAEFYHKLREKPVKVALIDDKVYGGVLVGLDQYDILLQQKSGLILLIPKHSIKWVAPAEGQSEMQNAE